ncbi:hypothetical protein Tco_0400472 [Tanacetum coccineum]
MNLNLLQKQIADHNEKVEAFTHRKQPVLYDGKTLVDKHDSIFVFDSEETLILAEESRLKMKDKQAEHNDKPDDYSKLNKLYEYFVPQKQLYVEQVYWLPVSNKYIVNVKPEKAVPKQLPKTSKTIMFFNKTKNQIDIFDELIKDKATLNVLNWGDFKFEKELHKEVLEMKEIFEGMETDVNACYVEKKYSEIEKKELLIKNDRLMGESISCDIMCTILRSIKGIDASSELSCMFIENVLNEYSTSLELSLQDYKEQMIRNESWKKHDASLNSKLKNKSFEINNLKAQLQDKSIAFNELKKLLTKLKGKGVDT